MGPVAEVALLHHQHGKSKVRVARVWRKGPIHHLVEWMVDIALLSDAQAAFEGADNSNVVATDTMKNTVYVIAKECKNVVSAEQFGIKLGQHFCTLYPMVSACKVHIVEKPWERANVGGEEHVHGFRLGLGSHTVDVGVEKSGAYTVSAGVCELTLLKTTQSGFEGFVRDKNTALPETRERIMATSVTATWKYASAPACYTEAYKSITKALIETFLGPPQQGFYSPSVQNTLFLMAKSALSRVEELEEISLSMPNLHFLPAKMPAIGLEFKDDVYVATSEPHGTIQASLGRGPRGFSSLIIPASKL